MDIAHIPMKSVIRSTFLVRDIEVKLPRSGTGYSYGKVLLENSTGWIECRKWNFREQDAILVPKGSLVDVCGTIDSWEGKRQIVINTMVPHEGDGDVDSFIYNSHIDKESLWLDILSYVEKISSVNIRTIINAMLTDNRDKFIIHPASKKNHHAYVSGLLLHERNMLKLADFSMGLYGIFNESYVYGGIIAHDMGKLMEMSHRLGADISYTKAGNLLGHISIGSMMVTRYATKLGIPDDCEDILNLQHVILSHHGKMEYGSPILPATPEAKLVNSIDNMDANVQAVIDGIQMVRNDPELQKMRLQSDNHDTFISGTNKERVEQMYHGVEHPL